MAKRDKPINDMQVVMIGNRTGEPPNEATREGNYFVSNYPPFSFWKPERAHEASAALDQTPAADTLLGIYVHIPFCRKRRHAAGGVPPFRRPRSTRGISRV